MGKLVIIAQAVERKAMEYAIKQTAKQLLRESLRKAVTNLQKLENIINKEDKPC